MDSNILDVHFFGGEVEIRRIKSLVEQGVEPTYHEGNRN